MTVYIVTREGVYRHEICGVYLTSEEAVQAALDLAELEPDDYHTFDVSSAVVGENIEDVTLVGSVRRKDDKTWDDRGMRKITRKDIKYLEGKDARHYIF